MSEAMDLKRAEIEALVDRKQQELSLLIKTGAEIEALVAAREGSPEVIRKLIEKGGFSLEARDESGLTPLALSCSSGSSNSKDHLDVARMLLAAGADVNAESARGSRPLHFACLNQNQVHSRSHFYHYSHSQFRSISSYSPYTTYFVLIPVYLISLNQPSRTWSRCCWSSGPT